MSPGAPQLVFMWTLNPAGSVCGSFPQMLLLQAPWNEFFSQPGPHLQADVGWWTNKRNQVIFKTYFHTLHPDFKMAPFAGLPGFSDM